jgi:hypothetical protein
MKTPTQPKVKPIRLYRVPVALTYVFREEVEIEATSIKEARTKIAAGDFTAESLEWSTAEHTHSRVGTWENITEIVSETSPTYDRLCQNHD